MKIKIKSVLLLTIIFISCTNNKPFRPILEQTLLEFIDSLEQNSKIDSNELISIEFQYFKKSIKLGNTMRIFLSDWYSGSRIDGYVKLNNYTIAFYNLRDDVYETVNKNNIIFFTDTIDGFIDVCSLGKSWGESKSEFYYSFEGDSIIRIPPILSFPGSGLIREPKCPPGEIYIVPKEEFFYFDSLQAEEDFEYYKKKVEYFRSLNSSKWKEYIDDPNIFAY